MPPICSLVRLSPSIGVMDGAHYRMSADILHPQKLQICGDPKDSTTLAQRLRKGNGKPQPLHLTPYTLHPTLYTLHLTLNPTLYTKL